MSYCLTCASKEQVMSTAACLDFGIKPLNEHVLCKTVAALMHLPLHERCPSTCDFLLNPPATKASPLLVQAWVQKLTQQL